jgi:hypothetical protein
MLSQQPEYREGEVFYPVIGGPDTHQIVGGRVDGSVWSGCAELVYWASREPRCGTCGCRGGRPQGLPQGLRKYLPARQVPSGPTRGEALVPGPAAGAAPEPRRCRAFRRRRVSGRRGPRQGRAGLGTTVAGTCRSGVAVE